MILKVDSLDKHFAIVDREAGQAPSSAPALRVAIVGTAPSRKLAPFEDLSWEIWGMASPDLPRWTRWFELHSLDQNISPNYPGLWAWLQAQYAGQIYLWERDPRVPQSQPYPLEEILSAFGSWGLTSTAAWAMALAISLGAKEIALWGIEMSDGSEYEHQKPGCQHFAALARRERILVSVPPGSELLSPGELYARGDETNWRLTNMKTRRAELQADLEAKLEAKAALELNLAGLRGALAVADYGIRNWK